VRIISSASRRATRLWHRIDLWLWRTRGILGGEQRAVPDPDFAHVVAEFGLPIIKPAAQAHLFEGKLHNLRLAISRMHGLVLPPGGGFSFADRVGPPTLERGFREGPSFEAGRVRSSPGGGLCQLSGLLYNLALLAGCEIRERHPHSIDAYGEARYVPLGRDATVAFGVKDLRFRNVLPWPLLLELTASETFAGGRVLSTSPLPFSVSIDVEGRGDVRSPVQVRRDDGLAPGAERVEPGLTGRRVTARRTFRYPDGQKRSQRLSRDVYRATPTTRFYGPSRNA
jgi:vancomycin resistance protein VanW